METTMHFGDGSFKTIIVPSEDPAEACQEAKDWVLDNAWFQVDTDDGTVEVSIS
jgi:hypothetical protein